MKKQNDGSNGAANTPPADNPEPQPATNKKNPPAEIWTEEELDEMAAVAAAQAGELLKDKDKLKFILGRVAVEHHEKVLKGAKRVPDNEDTYKRLAKHLAKMGMRKISQQRLRALAGAYKLQIELGGPGKAPNLSPDHFIEADREGLSLEDKRTILETAIVNRSSATGVRKHAQLLLKELGTEPVRDESYWHDWLEKSISRFQSAIMESCMVVSNHNVEIPASTRDRLNFTAVFLYQFANPRGPEGAK